MDRKFPLKCGFTLLELMVVVVILGLLAAIAIPSYQSYIRKSHRADAVSTLLAMESAQEKYRYNNPQYGTLAQVWGGVTASPQGYYTLSITVSSTSPATAYTLTATAVGDQANDSEGSTACTPLTLSVNNGVETKAPAVCWE